MKWFFNSHMSRKHKTNRQTNKQAHILNLHSHMDKRIHASMVSFCACVGSFTSSLRHIFYLVAKMPLICPKCLLPSGNYDISKWILHIPRETHTQHSASLTHTWHVYRRSIPKRWILSISTCLYIFVADGPFFDKDIDDNDDTDITWYGYQKPQPSNSLRPGVSKSQEWGGRGKCAKNFY